MLYRRRGAAWRILLPETEEIPEERPTMVILVGYPPLRNTLRTLRSLEDHASLARAPKIVLTTLDLPGDREKVLMAGAAGFDLKPLSEQKLQALLNESRL